MEAVRPSEVVTSWAELETLVLGQPDGRPEARRRTLEYIWTWCRCGVYLRVTGGQLIAFVPFANTEFRNTWNLRAFLPSRQDRWPAEALQPGALDPDSWWCNAGILCTQPGPEVWSTVLFPEFAAFFSAAARLAPDVDCEGFLNKRDFPNVRVDGADPYGATFFGRRGQVVHPEGLLPVFSCFVGDLFADVGIPLAQDHAAADRGAPVWSSRELFDHDWGARRPVAVFRGSATGCGCSEQRNPRLALLRLVGPRSEHAGFFDVCITGRNARIRKHPSEGSLRVLPPARRHERRDFLPLEEQRRRCRFAIYIEGHSATGRLAALLRNGFLVFLVETVVAPADKLFFTDWLEDRRHVVRCRLGELPAVVRYYATDLTGSREAAEIAWEGVLFHARWLAPRALEEHLAATLRLVSPAERKYGARRKRLRLPLHQPRMGGKRGSFVAGG